MDATQPGITAGKALLVSPEKAVELKEEAVHLPSIDL